ncbi:MAG: AAA family ATPase [Alphaproteobacteria bacterium]|nr:AAA family ATPase [Alphaproteobacteria bacterium]
MENQAEAMQPEMIPAMPANNVVADIPRVSIQAFCETQPTANAMQSAMGDRRFSKAHVDIQLGGAAAATQWFTEAATPNVLIVETRASADMLLSELGQLAGVCDGSTKVIVIGHVNDVHLYRTIMDQGVSDYLVAPISELQLISSVSSLYSAPDAAPVGRVCAFIGSKGGVGSSTLAHNVAWAISELLVEDVVITDLDLAFGTAGLNFNQDTSQGIAEALGAPDRVDDVLIDRLLTKCSERLSLLAAPGAVDRDYIVENDALDLILDLIRHSVPTVVVDLPNSWSPWTRETLIKADEVVVTATPDLASLRNTKNVIDMLKASRPNDQPPHLVLNQVGVPKRPEISAGDFARTVSLDPMIVLPYEPVAFATAANNGQMLFELEQKSKCSDGVLDLAKMLSGRAEPPQKKKKGLAPLFEKLAGKRK